MISLAVEECLQGDVKFAWRRKDLLVWRLCVFWRLIGEEVQARLARVDMEVHSLTEKAKEKSLYSEPHPESLLPDHYNQHEKPVGDVVIVWRNVTIFVVLHLFALYGVYLGLFSATWMTDIFAYFYAWMSLIGVTGGAHRLWSHRAYKAKLPLRILLMIMNSSACQNSVYEWSRDHRVHHKFSETDGDPHNINRGFFFAHMGWLMCKKHPDVLRKGKGVDCSDLLKDPVIRFQRKYFIYLTVFFAFYLPTVLPKMLWGESYWNAFFVATALRYVLSLHGTWLVNSAAHTFGNKPYDKQIKPTETPVVIYTGIGEGFHNYHHTFPWDYAASEIGARLNITTMFIDFFAMLGLAYDLKVVPRDLVAKRMHKSGDGTKWQEWKGYKCS